MRTGDKTEPVQATHWNSKGTAWRGEPLVKAMVCEGWGSPHCKKSVEVQFATTLKAFPVLNEHPLLLAAQILSGVRRKHPVFAGTG